MVRLILVLRAPEMDFDNFSCAYTFKIWILTYLFFVGEILRGFLRNSQIPHQIYFIFLRQANDYTVRVWQRFELNSLEIP